MNERLPHELGWTIRDQIVGQDDVMKVSAMIGAAASLLTDDAREASTSDAMQKHLAARRMPRDAAVLRDLHSGLRGTN